MWKIILYSKECKKKRESPSKVRFYDESLSTYFFFVYILLMDAEKVKFCDAVNRWYTQFVYTYTHIIYIIQ